MRKLEIIDLVRSFSILSVLAYHLGATHLPSADLSPGGQYLWSKICYNGSLGVSSFFLVSGFLITRLIAKGKRGLFEPDFRNFYSRRVGRIVPLLVLAILLGVSINYIFPHSDSAAFEFCFPINGGKPTFIFWLSLATFSFNWCETLFHFNYCGMQWGILWTISVEEQFYLFYPFLLMFVKNKGNLYQGLIFFVIFGTAVRFLNIWFYPEQVSYNSFQSFDQISLGCLLYLVSERFKKFLNKNSKFCFFLMTLGVLLAGFVYFHVPSKPELWWMIWNRFLFCSGVFLVLLGGVHTNWFESRVFTILALPGRLSYGMYLLHAWGLYFLWDILRNRNVFLDILIFSIGTTLIAYCSHRFFEMPLNIYLRKKLNPGA